MLKTSRALGLIMVLFISCSCGVEVSEREGEMCKVGKKWDELVYPWSHGTRWGEIHVPWMYQMDIEVVTPLE